MGDETANSMNLDLNLGPIPEPDEPLSDGSVSLEDFLVGVHGLRTSLEIHPLNGVDRLRERLRPREMHIRRHFDQIGERLEEIQSLRPSEGVNRIRDILRLREHRRSIWHRAPEFATTDSSDLITSPIVDSSSTFLSGEPSITPTERDSQIIKVTDQNNDTNTENEEIRGKGNEDKGNDDDTGSFFDCNICLDLAKDPIVTCCGHLFCWPCVYQWLNLHSVANECPVCKGEVSMNNVIPIYGRGNSSSGTEQDLPGLKIPIRPHAQRIGSGRQSDIGNSVSISMEELVRRLSERTGRVSRDQVPSGTEEPMPRDPLSERIASYILDRNREEQTPPLDVRDSASSIAAVIQSESQTIDAVLDIESNVSLPASTSGRRNGNDASRSLDVDNRDSRAYRRRRMN